MQQPKPALIITQNPDGSVSVSGPLDQKMWCYGLLEMAKDAIRDFNSKPQSNIIQPEVNIEAIVKDLNGKNK